MDTDVLVIIYHVRVESGTCCFLECNLSKEDGFFSHAFNLHTTLALLNTPKLCNLN